MDKKTVNQQIINGLASKGINIAEIELNHLEAFADIMYKAINVIHCSTELPTEKELILEIKNKLIEINKDKPVPSTKHDLGYSTGFIDCYEFMTK